MLAVSGLNIVYTHVVVVGTISEYCFDFTTNGKNETIVAMVRLILTTDYR